LAQDLFHIGGPNAVPGMKDRPGWTLGFVEIEGDEFGYVVACTMWEPDRFSSTGISSAEIMVEHDDIVSLFKGERTKDFIKVVAKGGVFVAKDRAEVLVPFFFVVKDEHSYLFTDHFSGFYTALLQLSRAEETGVEPARPFRTRLVSNELPLPAIG